MRHLEGFSGLVDIALVRPEHHVRIKAIVEGNRRPWRIAVGEVSFDNPHADQQGAEDVCAVEAGTFPPHSGRRHVVTVLRRGGRVQGAQRNGRLRRRPQRGGRLSSASSPMYPTLSPFFMDGTSPM